MQHLIKVFGFITLFMLIALTYNGRQSSVNANSLHSKMAEFSHRMRSDVPELHADEEPHPPEVTRKRREAAADPQPQQPESESKMASPQNAQSDDSAQGPKANQQQTRTRRQAPPEQPPSRKFNADMSEDKGSGMMRTKRQMPAPPSPPEGMPMPPM
ncbi:uncharacterized protein LOC119636765 [Glossina fuscipes]|uniref:Uncharacterized protein LOC119636765 n=1 Tax=Glossina fuscipes TaxID=7396 RepID=A0A9C5YVL1_9MUSC|nr:uncharacterized protein LOC119636765 [Glossina fuscipes]